MTLQLIKPNPLPRDLWRSIAAVFLGFVAVVVLSLGTDQFMHVLMFTRPGASQ